MMMEDRPVDMRIETGMTPPEAAARLDFMRGELEARVERLLHWHDRYSFLDRRGPDCFGRPRFGHIVTPPPFGPGGYGYDRHFLHGSEEAYAWMKDADALSWGSRALRHPGVPGRPGFLREVCPHCESWVEMLWDVDVQGYKAYCPVCGKVLMLCDECTRRGRGKFPENCEWDPETGRCTLKNRKRGECGHGKRDRS